MSFNAAIHIVKALTTATTLAAIQEPFLDRRRSRDISHANESDDERHDDCGSCRGGDGCEQGLLRFFVLASGAPPAHQAGASRERYRVPRGGAVEERTTSCGSVDGMSPTGSCPSIWAMRRSAAARPIASNGWRTVVSAGEA